MQVVITLSPRDYDAVLFDLDGVLTSGLIHSDDSQIGRSSSSSHYESRNCRQRHASRSPPA